MKLHSNSSPSFINIGVLLLFAIVIAVASTATTYYFLSSKTSEQSPIIQPPVIPPVQTNVIPTTPPPTNNQIITPDQTADWKTYINTDYGYQLNYPEILNTEIPDNAPQVFIISFAEKQDEYLEIEVTSISSLGLNQEIEFDMQRLNASKATFQNKPAVSIRPARNIYPGEPFKAMFIYLENKRFKIELGYYGNGTNEELFNQILSTFKFTE